MDTPIRQPVINAFIFGQSIFASIGTGIYLSTDAGQTFRLLKIFTGASQGLRCIFVARHGNVFVSPQGSDLADSEKGLWRSLNGGVSWDRVLSLSGKGNPVTIWGIDEDADGRLFAGIYTLAPRAALPTIYRSMDGGEHWEPSYIDVSGRHVHAVVVDQRTNAVYASIGDNFGIWKTKRLVKSSDHGESWQEILSDLPQVAPIVATPTARLFGSDYPGITRIYRTTDDESYQIVLSESANLYFFWMRRDETQEHLFASAVTADATTRQAKIYHSVDDGLSWHPLRSIESSAQGDGSAFASNVSESKLIAHLSIGGALQNALVLNLKQ